MERSQEWSVLGYSSDAKIASRRKDHIIHELYIFPYWDSKVEVPIQSHSSSHSSITDEVFTIFENIFNRTVLQQRSHSNSAATLNNKITLSSIMNSEFFASKGEPPLSSAPSSAPTPVSLEGINTKRPLTSWIRYIRLFINSPATRWGVSVWRFQVWGLPQQFKQKPASS